MSRPLSSLLRTAGLFFRHPAGKLVTIAGTAVTGAVASRVAERTGLVEDLAIAGMELFGIKDANEEPASPTVGKAPAAKRLPPKRSSSSSPAPSTALAIGHADAHGDCGCNKNPGVKKACTACKESDYVAVIAGYRELLQELPRALHSMGAVVISDVGAVEAVPWPPFFQVVDDPPPGGPPAPRPAVSIVQDGVTIDFKTLDAFKAWRAAQNKHVQTAATAAAARAAAAQKAASQKVLDSVRRQYQARLAAIAAQQAKATSDAEKKALQDQIDALKLEQAKATAVQEALKGQTTDNSAAMQQAILATAQNQPGDLMAMMRQLVARDLGMQPQPMAAPWGGPGTYDPYGQQQQQQQQIVSQQAMMTPYGPQYATQPGDDEDQFQSFVNYSLSGASEDLENELTAHGIADDYMAVYGTETDEPFDTSGCSSCAATAPAG